MKVSVCCQINYIYKVEIPTEVNVKNEIDLLNYVDTEDPVYRDLCGVLQEAGISFIGNTISILDNETADTLYAL